MPSVLVVTADEDLKELCTLTPPFEVICVGYEADHVTAAVKRQPEAVLIDVCYPSDWDAILSLRQSPESTHIPLVVITGWISVERVYRKRARELGCKAFIAKPCTPDILMDTLRRVMRGEHDIEILRGA